jgi:hypothetical protein
VSESVQASTGRPRGRPSKLSPAEKHEVRRYREAGVSIARLASMWHVSTTRIYEILAEQRAMFGPEQLPKDKRHLVRRHLFSSPQDKTAGGTIQST